MMVSPPMESTRSRARIRKTGVDRGSVRRSCVIGCVHDHDLDVVGRRAATFVTRSHARFAYAIAATTRSPSIARAT
jgi:hypothetical protein